MTARYTQEFKEQAVTKTLQRGDKTLSCIVDELNVNLFTLKERWKTLLKFSIAL